MKIGSISKVPFRRCVRERIDAVRNELIISDRNNDLRANNDN